MRRLHAGDCAQPREARDVRGIEHLRMLDAVARASPPGGGRRPLDRVQYLAVGSVADGVHRHLQPGAVGGEDERIHLGTGHALDAARRRVVEIRLQHQSGARTESAVGVSLDQPGSHPRVAGSRALAALLQRAHHFHRERQPAVDAYGEPAVGAQRAVDVELRRGDFALDAGDAGAGG